MKQRDIDALQTITYESEKIVRDTTAIDYGDFTGNELLYEATIWRIVLIGEAANRISPGTLKTLPHEPLRAAVGTRHRIIHGYDSIDSEIIYEIATIHIPALLKAIQHE